MLIRGSTIKHAELAHKKNTINKGTVPLKTNEEVCPQQICCLKNGDLKFHVLLAFKSSSGLERWSSCIKCIKYDLM